MEPMTLGSPVHSPSGPMAFPASPATFGQTSATSVLHHPGQHHSHLNASTAGTFGTPTGGMMMAQQQQQQGAPHTPGGHGYLPGYLMGDQMQQV